MFHVFSKVYLYPDFLAIDRPNKLVISKNKDAREMCRLRQTDVVYYDVEDLFRTFPGVTDWPGLLNHLMQSVNTTIYADADASAVIYAALLKTLFPTISQTVAWRVYNTAVQRITLHVSGDLAKDSSHLRRYALQEKVRLNQVEFVEVFNAVFPWANDDDRKKWVRDNVEEFSFEFHIASYFVDRSHLSHFSDKYVRFIIEACYTEVREWYDVFTIHCMQPIAKKALGHNVDWDTEDWRAELRKLPEMAWLFDDEFRFAVSDPLYLYAHLEEAHKLGQLTLKFIQLGTVMHHMAMNRDVHKHTLIDADYFESDHAQYVFKTLDRLLANLGHFTDAEIEAYIEEDIKDETVSTIFDLLNSHVKYNTWLMHYIYELRANSNPDLQQLRISI